MSKAIARENRTVDNEREDISRPGTPVRPGSSLPSDAASRDGHRLFRLTVVAVNVLLLISVGVFAWAATWEYSTRRYLKGFSDAIVPVSASPDDKIQAILDWMAHPPARIVGGIVGTPHDRDPLDTLNYRSLLQVCGTATNAFINLANSAGLPARRLLLLNADRGTKHVDAEVFEDGRWVVVDPTFRVILRGDDGKTLTRRDLADPAVFSKATRNIPRYDPMYSFERTAHVRLAGLKYIGNASRSALNFLAPGWDNSVTISLVMERESLAVTIVAFLAIFFLLVLRLFLRWYGEKRLHLHSLSPGLRLRRAYRAFVGPAS
jgi:hypothetical protein